MSTTRRGFLGALLALPILGRLLPAHVETQASTRWFLLSSGESFDAHMKRHAERYRKAQHEKYAASRANPIPVPGIWEYR